MYNEKNVYMMNPAPSTKDEMKSSQMQLGIITKENRQRNRSYGSPMW